MRLQRRLTTKWLGCLGLVLVITLLLTGLPGATLQATAAPSMFEADLNIIMLGEAVTFTNLCTLGTPPYTKAEWDFDGDGVFDKTITGSPAEVMADVVWVYYHPGSKSVTLRMTDSTAATYQETKQGYIIVLECGLLAYYDTNGDGVISKAEALVAVADYFAGYINKGQALYIIALYFSEEVN